MARRTTSDALRMARERNMTLRVFNRHREYHLFKGIHERAVILGNQYLTHSTRLKDIFTYLDNVKPRKRA